MKATLSVLSECLFVLFGLRALFPSFLLPLAFVRTVILLLRESSMEDDYLSPLFEATTSHSPSIRS